MKPLRELYKRFYRSDIPITGWTTKLIQLFEDFQNVFTSDENAKIFNTMLPLVAWQQQSIAELINNSSTYDAMHGLDSTFIPDKETRDVMEWIRVMMELVNKLVTIFDTFNQGLLWIPQTFMTTSIASKCATFVKNHMPNRW